MSFDRTSNNIRRRHSTDNLTICSIDPTPPYALTDVTIRPGSILIPKSQDLPARFRVRVGNVELRRREQWSYDEDFEVIKFTAAAAVRPQSLQGAIDKLEAAVEQALDMLLHLRPYLRSKQHRDAELLFYRIKSLYHLSVIVGAGLGDLDYSTNLPDESTMKRQLNLASYVPRIMNYVFKEAQQHDLMVETPSLSGLAPASCSEQQVVAMNVFAQKVNKEYGEQIETTISSIASIALILQMRPIED